MELIQKYKEAINNALRQLIINVKKEKWLQINKTST